MKLLFQLITLSLFTISSFGQSFKTKKADKKFDTYAYADASELYSKLIQKGFESFEIFAKLGDSYYLNADYENSLKAYSKMILLKNDNTVSNLRMLRYAQTLRSNGQIKEALNIEEKLPKVSTSAIIEELNVADFDKQKNDEYSEGFSIRKVSVNSNMPDFGVAFSGNQSVIFTSARDSISGRGRKDAWNNKPYFKLYQATIDESGDLVDVQKIKGKINSNYHQSSPAITSDGKTIYFTRSSFLNGKLKNDSNKINHLKIFRAKMIDGQWQDIEDLPFNGDAFSNAHPALSADGKKLVFASDRPGSIGLTDLYEVLVNDDGTFGEVRNMGLSINTIGRETFPFISSENEFYFASDGHLGFGGLDIFKASENSLNNYNVKNMGKSLNTSEDDFGFIINSEKRTGYFASNRSGEDEIYSFYEIKNADAKTYELLVFGKVKDKTYNEPIPNVKVILYDLNNKVIDTYYTDNSGEYLIKILTGDYRLAFEKLGYIHEIDEILIENKNSNQLVEINKFILKDPAEKQLTIKDGKIMDGSDLAKVLKLDPIYFDFDGSKVRPISQVELNKIVNVLKDFPTVTLDVRSHTDSRGPKNYNIILSERRMKSTIEYLIDKGIRPERITGKGYGESQLINDCNSDKKCSEKQHQMNRRSEFIIKVN